MKSITNLKFNNQSQNKSIKKMNTTHVKNEKAARTQKRNAQLFVLGLAKTGYGFIFKGYYVAADSIENMKDEEWEPYVERIAKHMAEVRESYEYSEKEKALYFIEMLRKVELPYNFKEGRIKEIMDGGIYTLSELTNYLEEEVNNAE